MPLLAEALERFAAQEQAAARFEFILVDDGSTDGTWAAVRDWAVRDRRVRGVRFSRNFGHQHALFTGYREARGDAAVCLDGDLQDPPAVISRMLEAWRGGAEVIFAVRTRREGETRLKRATAFLFYRLLALLAETDAPLDAGDFRLLDRRALDALLAMPERHRYLRGMVGWIGFERAVVTYERPARVAGDTSFSWKKMLLLGLDGVVSFSVMPLRLTFALAALGAAPFVALVAWAALRGAMGMEAPPPGWTSLMLAVVTFGALILLAIGLVGEYVGRIFEVVKARPDVIVRERCGVAPEPESVGGGEPWGSA